MCSNRIGMVIKQQERQSSQQMMMNNPKKISQKTNPTQLLSEKINTINDSLVYIKGLIALTVSNVTYLRGLFNDDCYDDRKFEDINVKILSTGSDSTEQLTKWLYGAYDAIDKKYLKSMVLAFFSDVENPDMVLETYDFGFRYADEGALMTLDINDKKSIVCKAKKNATRILRALQVISSTLEPLPKETFITMKLYYYDGVTPIDYEPPGFQPARNKKFNFVGEKINLQVGHVNTLWHLMKLNIVVSNEMMKECDAFGDLSVNTSRLDDTKSSSSSFNENETTFDVSMAPVDDQPKAYNMNELKKALDDKKLDQTSKKLKKPSVVVKCGCKMDDVIPDGLIQCGVCKYWQHKVCFRVKNDINSSGLKHICPNCMMVGDTNSANDEVSCLDQSIIGLNENELFQLCIIRRLLNDFIEKTKFTKTEMADKYGNDNVNWLINRLTKEGHIKCSNSKKLVYQIVNSEETLKSSYINGTIIKIIETPEIEQELVGTSEQTLPFVDQISQNKEDNSNKNVQFDENNNKNENVNIMETDKLNESTTSETSAKKRKSSEPIHDKADDRAKKQKVSDSKMRIKKSK